MTLPLLLAALLAAAPGDGDPPEAEPAARAGEAGARWTRGPVKLGAFLGAFDGREVRTDSGGAALLEVRAGPGVKVEGWKLTFPLRLHHFQTIGASLPETAGSAAARAERRVLRGLRLGVEAGLSGAWRPGWPDLYQPVADAGGIHLAGTDRYSYLAWHAGASAAATPLAGHRVRLRYEYVHTGYVRDPAFRETSPMHLTPRDNGRHRLEGAWSVLGDGWVATALLGFERRLDEVYLARHAVTGSTGSYTTPTQRLDRLEPAMEVTAKRAGGRLEATFSYGYQLQDDRFEGYYSYAGHHPRLAVAWALSDRLSARVRGEAWLRQYGPASKAAGLAPAPPTTGSGHLETGSRLYDRKGALSATASYRLTEALSLKVAGEWVRRSTNYPDYLPGVYPSTRLYDIEWSYQNTLVLAGVELAL